MTSVVKKMLLAGLSAAAKKHNTKVQDIQFVIFLTINGETPEINYWSYVNFEPKEKITFKEATDKVGKIAIIDYENLTQQFIINKMNQYFTAYEVEVNKLFFVVYATAQEKIRIKVLNDVNPIADLELKELFE